MELMATRNNHFSFEMTHALAVSDFGQAKNNNNCLTFQKEGSKLNGSFIHFSFFNQKKQHVERIYRVTQVKSHSHFGCSYTANLIRLMISLTSPGAPVREEPPDFCCFMKNDEGKRNEHIIWFAQHKSHVAYIYLHGCRQAVNDVQQQDVSERKYAPANCAFPTLCKFRADDSHTYQE